MFRIISIIALVFGITTYAGMNAMSKDFSPISEQLDLKSFNFTPKTYKTCLIFCSDDSSSSSSGGYHSYSGSSWGSGSYSGK